MKNHLPKAKFKVVNVCVLQNEVHSTPKKTFDKAYFLSFTKGSETVKINNAILFDMAKLVA